jgi:DNA-directed RNA polymerase subunit L
MELKAVKQDEKKLILELREGTIGFVNLLRDELWRDPSIKEAAAIREHPYLAEPKILVAVSRGSPQSALEKTTESLIEQTKEFREKFKAALKK